MIDSLVLQNFRCFESLSLQFNKKHILLSGSNGQGKSSVLEAVFFLANLRSFRTARISDLFRIGSQSFRIHASAHIGAFS
ncbi:MAG: AAA family ATPase [Lentisphaeria bacterium]|nr:AAA family ATPase [Lentisphaeria bacterium]